MINPKHRGQAIPSGHEIPSDPRTFPDAPLDEPTLPLEQLPDVDECRSCRRGDGGPCRC